MPGADPIKLADSVQKSGVHFRHARWQGKRVCPRRGHRYAYHTQTRHACKRCRYVFGDLAGTCLGRIRATADKTAHLPYLFSPGVPAYRTGFSMGINPATTHHAFRVFREAICDSSIEDLAMLSGKIGMDEAPFGGHRRGKRGWGAEGRTAVFGIHQRSGHVLTFPVTNRGQVASEPIIKGHTGDGSLYCTDDCTAYASMGMLVGRHGVVTHAKNEHVRGDAHINGMGGFWSHARNWLYQYRGVSRRYFHFYPKEIECRFNNRNHDLFGKLTPLVVKNIEKSVSFDWALPSFNYRVQSDTVLSFVTNLHLIIEDQDRERLVGIWLARGGTMDTGNSNYFVDLGGLLDRDDTSFTVKLAHHDYWGADWNQQVNIDNFHVGTDAPGTGFQAAQSAILENPRHIISHKLSQGDLGVYEYVNGTRVVGPHDGMIAQMLDNYNYTQADVQEYEDRLPEETVRNAGAGQVCDMLDSVPVGSDLYSRIKSLGARHHGTLACG